VNDQSLARDAIEKNDDAKKQRFLLIIPPEMKEGKSITSERKN
jgi:hypothetical protein